MPIDHKVLITISIRWAFKLDTYHPHMLFAYTPTPPLQCHCIERKPVCGFLGREFRTHQPCCIQHSVNQLQQTNFPTKTRNFNKLQTIRARLLGSLFNSIMRYFMNFDWMISGPTSVNSLINIIFIKCHDNTHIYHGKFNNRKYCIDNRLFIISDKLP